MPTPEQQRQYEELVEAIVRAVPEIEEFCSLSERVDGKLHSWEFDGDDPYIVCYWCKDRRRAPGGEKMMNGRGERRPITLEDVLRAYRQFNGIVSPMLLVNDDGWFVLRPNGPTRKQWHLGHDLAWHLRNAPEMISFLHSLLLP